MSAVQSQSRSAPEACQACDQQNWEFAFRKSTADFWRCKGCGFVRQFPLPTDEELHEHYKQIHETGICSLYLKNEEMRKRIFDHWWSLLESAMPKGQKGKLLDVGCSSGIQMEVAQAHGWDVYGVEPTQESAQRAKKRFGARIFEGFLHDAKYPDNHFDCAILFDVFEHLPNPGPIFDEVFRVLKPGGWIAITTADTGTMIGKGLGKNWFLYIPHEHLFYCNRENMTLFLKRRGFAVRRIRRAVKQMSLDYAIGALRFLGPGLHTLLKAPLALLPKKLKESYMPLYGGEMLVMAQKSDSKAP